ncbi:hypothetical protein TWF696_007945 [Orbilia brochopaga]|uniref:Uncharacterized protein n=1 Tax=Orbilia brochopaga TaxID=3140254 RepID=A0AAV9UQ40_9PEZI
MTVETELEAAVTTAFISGPESLMTNNADPTQEPRFILNTNGYETVQLYVTAGLKLAEDKTAYEEWMPRKDFQDIDSIDEELYTLANQGLLSVSRSCRRFNEHDMGEVWSSPTLVIEYCEKAIQDLQDGQNSLNAHWKVLVDEKYRIHGSEDAAFGRARTLAISTLNRLEAYATTKKREATNVRNILTRFQNETTANLSKVRDLDRRFNDTEVSKDGKSYKSISELLNAELTELKAESERNQRFKDDWDNPASSKFDDFLIWEDRFSFFGDSTLTKLARLYRVTEAKIEKATAEKKKITVLILHISRLNEICQGLMPKMQDAIRALGELEALFDSQSSSLKEIARLLGILTEDVSSLDFDIRDVNIPTGLSRAVITFRKVKNLAEEYKRGRDSNPAVGEGHAH